MHRVRIEQRTRGPVAPAEPAEETDERPNPSARGSRSAALETAAEREAARRARREW